MELSLTSQTEEENIHIMNNVYKMKEKNHLTFLLVDVSRYLSGKKRIMNSFMESEQS